jgi:hypothetical protein
MRASLVFDFWRYISFGHLEQRSADGARYRYSALCALVAWACKGSRSKGAGASWAPVAAAIALAGASALAANIAPQSRASARAPVELG